MEELLANPAVLTGATSLAGTLAAFALVFGLKALKAFVLKTENKLDDAILKGFEDGMEKALKKVMKKKK